MKKLSLFLALCFLICVSVASAQLGGGTPKKGEKVAVVVWSCDSTLNTVPDVDIRYVNNDTGGFTDITTDSNGQGVMWFLAGTPYTYDRVGVTNGFQYTVVPGGGYNHTVWCYEHE